MVVRIAAYVLVIAGVIWAIGEFAQAPTEYPSPEPLPRVPPMPDDPGPADEPAHDEPPPEPAPEPEPKPKGGLLGLPVG